jgi:hypothetical protein
MGILTNLVRIILSFVKLLPQPIRTAPDQWSPPGSLNTLRISHPNIEFRQIG